MKRSFSLSERSPVPLLIAGMGLIAATYGLVRLAYGLFLPDVQDALEMDVGAAGAVSAGASVVYCIAALIGFVSAARYTRGVVIAAGAVAALGAAGMAWAGDASLFAVSAITASGGAGLASPAMVAVLQRDPSTREDPRAQSVVNAGTGPGLIIAALLGLFLLPDWRLAWTVSAVATVVVTAAVVLLAARGAHPAPHTAAIPPASWFGAHRRPITAAVLMGVGCAAVWNFGRTLLVDADAGTTVSISAWIAVGVGGLAVAVTTRWTQRLAPQRLWILTTGTIAAATLLLALVPQPAVVALFACAVFGWGYVAGSGALIEWTAELDPERAPAGTALLFVTLILGQAVGATVIGALIPAVDYPVAFLVAAATAALAVLPAVPGARRPVAQP